MAKLKRIDTVRRTRNLDLMDLDGSIESIITLLNGFIVTYGKDVYLSVDQYYDNITIQVVYYTPETDEEYTERCAKRRAELKKERNARKTKERGEHERDLEEFKRLKKKLNL